MRLCVCCLSCMQPSWSIRHLCVCLAVCFWFSAICLYVHQFIMMHVFVVLDVCQVFFFVLFGRINTFFVFRYNSIVTLSMLVRLFISFGPLRRPSAFLWGRLRIHSSATQLGTQQFRFGFYGFRPYFIRQIVLVYGFGV